MKMPDEIKKALKCHRDGRACHDCPYEQGRTFSVDGVTFGCSKAIIADALEYIERLEAKMEERAMSKTPKCPGCGADMELMHLHNTIFYYVCTKCGWDSPGGSDPESAFRMAMRRAEPKNRVMTREEILRKIYADDLEFSWIEFAKDTHTNLYHLNQFILENENPEDKTIDLFFFGVPDPWQREKESDYGKTWRCWLHKPTKEEMEETPWEGDSHE